MPEFTYKEEEHKAKSSFWPSDFGKLTVELWCALRGVPVTNPPVWHDTLKWGAGKGVELQMLKVLKDSGIVAPSYQQEEHGDLRFMRGSVEIHGKMDAVTQTVVDRKMQGFPEGLDGDSPIEIKSINNKNLYDIRDYQEGRPRTNYVGQLAVYCDGLARDRGYLFAASVDGLSTFWFPCERVEARRFRCGSVEVDLDAEYARFAKVKAFVDSGKEPDWNEVLYKTPVHEIDWKAQSKAAIKKARAGTSVIGDYRIKYSPWKDYIISKQGTTVGYTDEELSIIRSLTTSI